MRADMAKVIVERPRHGHATLHYRRPRGTVEQLEELPAIEGIRNVRRNRDWKEFSDLLGPLRRFVQSNVGRPWDKVYSEICERLKPTSTAQQHVLDHLKGMVETKTRRLPDGTVVAHKNYGGISEVFDTFYVDPDSGILRDTGTPQRRWRSIHRQEQAQKAAEIFLNIAPERELHKVDGIWYWAVFSDWPQPYWSVRKITTEEGVTFSREIVYPIAHDTLPGPKIPGRYRSGKRQASGRDLREHGVQNDVPDDE